MINAFSTFAARQLGTFYVVVKVARMMCRNLIHIICAQCEEVTLCYVNLSSLIDRRYTCYCLSFSNSAVNPVIYNAVSSKYRRAFRRVFCPCVSRSERHQFVSSVGDRDSSHRLNDEASNVPDCTEGTYM